ncbi:hypothetical protein SAMN02745866_03106 [Alteromonadaceae bacterium Bs31]|nr:hypothetical protein SAMN02745866_03106 [Alteromonadaceae bacterium Bs31]
MTALDICTTFLAIRLKLEVNDELLKREICALFDASSKSDFTHKLNRKFLNDALLEKKYRAWCNKLMFDVLSEDEIYSLVGADRLHKFSKSLQVFPSVVSTALIELLPVIVSRFGEDFSNIEPINKARLKKY